MKLMNATLALTALLALTAPSPAEAADGIPESAFKAALRGPQKKGIRMNLPNNSSFKYNVRPVSISRVGAHLRVIGKLDVDRPGTDDELWYVVDRIGTGAPTFWHEIRYGHNFSLSSSVFTPGIAARSFATAVLGRVHEAPTVSGRPRVTFYEHTALRGYSRSHYPGYQENSIHPSHIGAGSYKYTPAVNRPLRYPLKDKVSSFVAVVPAGYTLVLRNGRRGRIELAAGRHVYLDLEVHKLNDKIDRFYWSRNRARPSGLDSGRGSARPVGMSLRPGAKSLGGYSGLTRLQRMQIDQRRRALRGQGAKVLISGQRQIDTTGLGGARPGHGNKPRRPHNGNVNKGVGKQAQRPHPGALRHPISTTPRQDERIGTTGVKKSVIIGSNQIPIMQKPKQAPKRLKPVQ